MRLTAAAAKGLVLLTGFLVLGLGQAASSPRKARFRRSLQISGDQRETSSSSSSVHSQRGTDDAYGRRWVDSETYKYSLGRKKREAESIEMAAQVTDDQEPLFSLEKFDTIDTRLLESFVRPYRRQEEDLREKRKVDSYVDQDSYSSIDGRKSSQRSRSSSRSIQTGLSGPRNQFSSPDTRNSDRNLRLELRDTRNMLKLLHGMPSEFKKRFISLLLRSDRSGLSELVREMIAFHMGSGKVKELSFANFNQVSGHSTVSRGKSVPTRRISGNPLRSTAKDNFEPSLQFNARQGNLEESLSSKETASKLPVIESAVILHRELISEPGRVIIPLNGQGQRQDGKEIGSFPPIHGKFVPNTNPLAQVTTTATEKNRMIATSSRSQIQSGKRNRNKEHNTRISNPVPRPRNPITKLEKNNLARTKQAQLGSRQRLIPQSPGQTQQGFDTDEFSHLLEQIRHSPAFDRIMGNILAMLKVEQKLAEITFNEKESMGKSIISDSAPSNNDEHIVGSITSQDMFEEPATSVFVNQRNESNSQFNDLLGEATPKFVPEEDILHGEILDDGLTTIENRINAEIIQSTLDHSFDDFSSPGQSFAPSLASLDPNVNTFTSGNFAVNLHSDDLTSSQFHTPSENLEPNDNSFTSGNSAVDLHSDDFTSSQFHTPSENLAPNDNTFAPGNLAVNRQSDDLSSSHFPPSSANVFPNDNTFGSGSNDVNRHSDDFSVAQLPSTSANLVHNENAFVAVNSPVNQQSDDVGFSQFPQFNPSQADPLLPPVFSSPASGPPIHEPKRIVPLSTDLRGQFFEEDVINFRQQTSRSSSAKGNVREKDQFSSNDQVNFVPLSTDFDGQLDGFPLQDTFSPSGNTETSQSGSATLPEDVILSKDSISGTGPDDDFGLAIGDFVHQPFENVQDQDGSGVQLQNSPASSFSSSPQIPMPGGENNIFLSSSGHDSHTNNQITLPPNIVDGSASGSLQSLLQEAGTFRENLPSQSTSDIFFPESDKVSSPVTFGDIMNSHSNTDTDKEFVFPNHSSKIAIVSDSLPSQSTSDFRSFGETPPGSSFTDDFLAGDFIDDGISLHDFEFVQSELGKGSVPVGIPLPGLNRSRFEINGPSHSIGVPHSGIGFQPTNFNNDIPNSGSHSVGVPLPSGGEFVQSGLRQEFQPVGIPLPVFNRSMSEISVPSPVIGVPLPGIVPQQSNFNNDVSNSGTQSLGVPLPSGVDSSSTIFGNQFRLSNQENSPVNFELDHDSGSFETSDRDPLQSDERIFLSKDFGPATQAFKNNLSSFSYDAVDATGYPEENVSKNHRFVTFLTPGLIYPYSAKDAVYQGGSGLVQHYNAPQQYIYPSQGYHEPQHIPHQYLQSSINSGYRVPNGYLPPAALAQYDGRRKHKQIPSSTYTAPPPIPAPYDSVHNPCPSRTVVLTTVLIKDKPPSVTTILDRVTSVHMVDRYFVSPVTVLQPYSPSTTIFNNYNGGYPLTYPRTDPPSRIHKLRDNQYEGGAPSQVFGLEPEVLGLLHKPGDRLIRHAGTVRDAGQTVRASGQTVRASGQTLRDSDQTVRDSDQTVRDSDQTVRDSGQTVRASGQTVWASGQTVRDSGQTVRDSDQTVRSVDVKDQNDARTRGNSTVEVIRLRAFQYARRRRSASAKGAHIYKLEPYAIHTKTIAATPYTPEPHYIMDQTVHGGLPASQVAQTPKPQLAYTVQPQLDYTSLSQLDHNADVVDRLGRHYGLETRMIKSTYFRTLSTKVPKTIVSTRSLVSTISYGQTLTTIRSTSVFCIEPAPKNYYESGVAYQGVSVYNPQVGTPPLPLYTQNVAESYNAPLLLPHASYQANPSQFRTWVGSLMDDENGSGYDSTQNKFVLLQHMWPKAFVLGDGTSEGYTRINLIPGNPYFGAVNRRLELPVDGSSDSSGSGKSLVTLHQPLIQSSLRH